MSSSNNAISLLTQIKEKIQDGRIADLPAVHVALEEVIARLIHQQVSEPSDNKDDDLLKILNVVERVLSKCLETITSTVQSKSKGSTTAKRSIAPQPASAPPTTTAKRPIAPQPAPAPPTTTVNTSTTLAAAGPLPPPFGVPHPKTIKTAYISFPPNAGPRTVTIHPPGSPNYQPIIRDEHGEIVIGLNSYWHTTALLRQAAFHGENNLEVAARNEAPLYGRQPGPKVPLAPISVPADALDRLDTVQPLTRKADAAEAKSPSPALDDGQGMGKKRARDEEDENEDKDKAAGDKPLPLPEGGAEEPRCTMPLLNRAVGFSFNSEEGQPPSPTPAGRRPQPHVAHAIELAKRKRARCWGECRADPSMCGKEPPADSS